MRAWFDAFARLVTHWTGTSQAFFVAIAIIVVWVITGPFFHFSDTWQLVINTGTTIVTFLMVFVIQQAQNREMLAVHIKLNEIVASMKGASNRVLNIEESTDEQVEKYRHLYESLLRKIERNEDVNGVHSVEEVCDKVIKRKAQGDNHDR